jgi:hypothetical protein
MVYRNWEIRVVAYGEVAENATIRQSKLFGKKQRSSGNQGIASNGYLFSILFLADEYVCY